MDNKILGSQTKGSILLHNRQIRSYLNLDSSYYNQVLAEYNKSVICFQNTLKIQPDFEAAEKRKHAVLCHAKLEAALEAQHRYHIHFEQSV